MKKGLLLLLAVFSMGMARAQVEVTDVSSMDYAVYFDSPVVTLDQGTMIPLYLKTKWGVQGVQGDWVLPEGFTVDEAGSFNENRFDPVNKGSVFAPNNVRFAATVLSNTGFYAGDDVLAYVTINVAADVEPGEYPITFKNVKFGGILTDGTEEVADFWLDEIVCKITVSEDYQLYDYATTLPANNTQGNFVVHRTIKAKEWSTICLPFAMTGDQVKEAFGEDVQFADFAGADIIDGENIHVNFTTVDAVNQGTKNYRPYIIKVSKNIDQFRVKNATIKRAGSNVAVGTYKFSGTVTPTTIPAQCLYLSGNKFYYSIGKTKTKAFRAYIDLGDDVLDEYWDAAEVKINFSVDEATAITNIDMTNSNTIYNVNGIKMGNDMNRLSKGIYIVNGKKIVK